MKFTMRPSGIEIPESSAIEIMRAERRAMRSAATKKTHRATLARRSRKKHGRAR